MKLGMNLLLWSDDVTDDAHAGLFDRLAALGYDGVEVPVFHPAPARFARLGRRLADAGLACTAVSALGPEHDPIHESAAVRAAAVERMRTVAACAAAVGAPLLVGPLYAALGVFRGRGPTADEWARGVETVGLMADEAARVGVGLALEPLNRFEIYLLNTAADGARFVRELGRPGCGLLYDTFHAHIEEKDVEAALRGATGTLAHVHLSECDRGTPGTGQVAWDRTFATLRAVGYDGWLTVEAFGTGMPALAAATKIWRRTYDSEDQLARDAIAFVRRALAAAGPRT